MKPQTFFITGVPGAGKSSLKDGLRSRLSSAFAIHDLDERGVPNNVDIIWRQTETSYWISEGDKNAQQGISTVICGFALPEEARKDSYFVLLDLSELTLRDRLNKRYQDPLMIEDLKRATGQSPQEFIDSQMPAIPWLRQKCIEANAKIIDTNSLTINQVVEEVSDYLRSF